MAIDPFRPVFAAGAALLVASAVAQADSPDEQFLGMLSNDGLSVGPPDESIAIAHERCKDEGLPRSDSYSILNGGHPSPWRVAMSKIAGRLQGMGLTDQQTRQFMQDAINV